MNGDGQLVSVVWDGLELMPGERDDGLLAIVTDVEGWYGSPPLDGHDLERALTDGSLWGPKIIQARPVTLTGQVHGPRDLCLAFTRDLEMRAASRLPATLAISEPTGQSEYHRVLTADVRAGTDRLAHAWHGPVMFDWQVTLTAADPRLYGEHWNFAELTVLPPAGTGRAYPRAYPSWVYGAAVLPNSALLVNDGNEAAPVQILYAGDLSESRLQPQGQEGLIRAAALPAGAQILVDSASLSAVAQGGATRASYILPGSAPLMIPAQSSVRWSLYATGYGSVRLSWRDTWA